MTKWGGNKSLWFIEGFLRGFGEDRCLRRHKNLPKWRRKKWRMEMPHGGSLNFASLPYITLISIFHRTFSDIYGVVVLVLSDCYNETINWVIDRQQELFSTLGAGNVQAQGRFRVWRGSCHPWQPLAVSSFGSGQHISSWPFRTTLILLMSFPSSWSHPSSRGASPLSCITLGVRF